MSKVFLLSLLFCNLLIGCGQTGKLYLPKKTHEQSLEGKVVGG